MSLFNLLFFISGDRGTPKQQLFDIPGTYSWTVPTGITSISAVCVGGGGGGSGNASTFDFGAGGGGLSYSVGIAVTEGESLTINVGMGGTGGSATAGSDGQTSSILRGVTTLLHATGGQRGVNPGGSGGSGGVTLGYSGGGNGGKGGNDGGTPASQGGGGGGAGGYGGNGGAGGNQNGSGQVGVGGGGGGGSYGGTQGGGGGGVGVGGSGPSGAGGSVVGGGGGGGSLGSDGYGDNTTPSSNTVVFGGLYGGGGSGGDVFGSQGGGGAVRIIWGGGRAYPLTGTEDQFDTSSSVPAAPTLIGTSSNNITSSNVTSIDLSKPAGTQAGDFVVVMLTGGGGSNNVGDWTNTDFTFLYENTTSGTVNSAIAYRVLTGSEGASFTFTTSNACKLSGELVVYRGATQISASTQNLQASGSTLTANSITGSVNSILFAMFAQQNDNAAFSSAPGDLTLLRTVSTSVNHNYWIGYKTLASSGSTGNYQITSSLIASSANFLFTIDP